MHFDTPESATILPAANTVMFYGRQLPLCARPCERLGSGLHPQANWGYGPLCLHRASGVGEGKQQYEVTHAVPGQRVAQFTGSLNGQSTAEVLMRLKQQQQLAGMRNAICGVKTFASVQKKKKTAKTTLGREKKTH